MVFFRLSHVTKSLERVTGAGSSAQKMLGRRSLFPLDICDRKVSAPALVLRSKFQVRQRRMGKRPRGHMPDEAVHLFKEIS